MNNCYGYGGPDWTPNVGWGSSLDPIPIRLPGRSWQGPGGKSKVILIEPKTVFNLPFVYSHVDILSFGRITFMFYVNLEE